jgi:nucleoid-associated protein YgaU
MRGLGLLGLVVLGTAGTLGLMGPEALPGLGVPPGEPAVASRPAPAAAPAPARPLATAAPTVAAPVAPSFDVARVGVRGMLVTAGRAAPGAEVRLLDAGQELGKARTDARGEWVILPAHPLPPGLRELSLLARLAGGEPVPSRETLLLLVPDPPGAPVVLADAAVEPAAAAMPRADPAMTVALPAAAADAPALALLLPPTTAHEAPTRLLQAPGPAAAAPAAAMAAASPRLGLDVVDYDEAGAMRFAGSASPGARVRVYVGPHHAGDTEADASGRWTLSPERQPEFGRHTLRVDQLAAAGSVAARIEVPFQRDWVSDDLLRDGRVIVQPGHSLWRISRQVYGRGVRYTTLYAANRDQIRNPALIYPGQVFSVPGDGSPDGPQAESSRSR